MLTSHDDLVAAAARLRAGGVVAFPTETVYGLGADALNADAVERVFALKGRPAHNPLIVHVDGAAMAQRVVAAWPDAAERLARAFWPGPLTIVLPRGTDVPDNVVGGPGATTVAVRSPDHPTAAALLMLFGGPLVGPSANASGRVSPTAAAHVREAFNERDVLVLDGGACGTGIESTVVSLAGAQPCVLRRGVIGAEAIAGVLGITVVDATTTQQVGTAGSPSPVPLTSPGMLPTHYAPLTRAALFDSWELIEELVEDGERIVALAYTVAAEDEGWADRGCTLVRMPVEARAYATRLYAALREADAVCGSGRADLIAIERPPVEGPDADATAVWLAIADRLARATA
ncbi:MAG: L-threonylcarbamoyladenylate synthase [Phycisphaerales bacterium]